ncbi:hypothetical protein CHCC20375_0483 [Bacillus licheniformis]|nr:hypothetical protein CHCC20375_0483 [Bacillus licheniformis]
MYQMDKRSNKTEKSGIHPMRITERANDQTDHWLFAYSGIFKQKQLN